jgi:hypothetical protein
MPVITPEGQRTEVEGGFYQFNGGRWYAFIWRSGRPSPVGHFINERQAVLAISTALASLPVNGDIPPIHWMNPGAAELAATAPDPDWTAQ